MSCDRQVHRIKNRPKLVRSGEAAFFTDRKFFERRDELALILELITKRELFGYVYSGINPDYFYKMPKTSGVFVIPILPTHILVPGVHQPGDIDILIIPYENENLILEQSVAVEVKIIRALYKKQGKSPNEFGFTQAEQLLRLGFPYVAVVHIVVSDRSPREAWRETSIFQVMDASGRVEPLPPQYTDLMPRDLINRAFGRLVNSCQDPRIGVSAAYIELENSDDLNIVSRKNGLWLPQSRSCRKNLQRSSFLLDRVGKFFDKYAEHFLDNPRFDL